MLCHTLTDGTLTLNDTGELLFCFSLSTSIWSSLISTSNTEDLPSLPERLQFSVLPAREPRSNILRIPFSASTIHILGVVGRDPKSLAFKLVVLYPYGVALRRRSQLPVSFFDVSLSPISPIPENTVSSKLCDRSTLLDRLFQEDLMEWDKDQLDALAMLRNVEASKCLCHRFSLEAKSWVRLGDSYEGKIGILAYARALQLDLEEAQRKFLIKKIIEYPTLPPLFTIEEKNLLESIKDKDIQTILLRPWSKEFRREIRDAWILRPHNDEGDLKVVESRERFLVYSVQENKEEKGIIERWNELPRFFSWIIPFTLAVTLTAEQPLSESFFEGTCMKSLSLPTINYESPSLEQFDIFMSRFVEDVNDGGSVLVHCGGGKGRAGSILAAYLSLYGFNLPSKLLRNDTEHESNTFPVNSASKAIEILRYIRPGSIETSVQEDFVARVERRAWKLGSTEPISTDLSESESTPLEIEGSLPKFGDVDFIILVGIPASGKSWFRERLCRICPSKENWKVLSGDEIRKEGFRGAKSVLEQSIGKSGRTILDRCNVTKRDRQQWLSLASWAKHPIIVYFDYSSSLCINRAQRRHDHPTLLPGPKVERAVRDFESKLEPPDLSEKVDAIIIVKSFQAANTALERLLGTSQVPLAKFPRTGHLIDLGSMGEDDVLEEITKDLDDGTRIIITEKVDGAQLGFSLSSSKSLLVQNRSHYIHNGEHPQFSRLSDWTSKHYDQLFSILFRDPDFPERYVLYGEWLVAQHSIPYTKLTDWFLAFDLYDRKKDRWYSRDILVDLLSDTCPENEQGIRIVPLMITTTTVPTNKTLREMTQLPSGFYDGKVEGVYVKWERQGKVCKRGKVVREDFITGQDHWSKKDVIKNSLISEPN